MNFMSKMIGLAVCRNFQREAQEIARLEKWEDAVILSYECCCDRGACSWHSLGESLGADVCSCSRVCLFGTWCLPVGEPRGIPATVSVRRASHCLALITNQSLLDHWAGRGCFMVSPGWLGNWKETVALWGYDEQSAREHFREFAQVLLLLDTGLYPSAGEDLKDMAAFFGLEPEILPVGLDLFSHYLQKEVFAARVDAQRAAVSAKLSLAQRQAAEREMLLDLSAKIITIGDESEVLGRILEVVGALLPPHDAFIASIGHKRVRVFKSHPAKTVPENIEALLQESEDLSILPDHGGFVVRFRSGDSIVGLIHVTDITMPEALHQYANTVASMAALCALAIMHSRALVGIVPICAGCKNIRDARGTWHPIESYVRDHTEADFSHSLCPVCSKVYFPDQQ
jgi:hypothetical protein